jgi:hypothetical protein
MNQPIRSSHFLSAYLECVSPSFLEPRISTHEDTPYGIKYALFEPDAPAENRQVNAGSVVSECPEGRTE